MLNRLSHIFFTAILCTAAAFSATVSARASQHGQADAVGVVKADSVMANRAARFFRYREWASAAALYTTLIDRDPKATAYYGPAIVASGMVGDTLRQTRLTQTAFGAHIAVDSLFSSVERTSFSVGQTSLYENYLLLTKRHEPWLTRIVDSYLMRYYAYRRDPEGMIAYAGIMLAGNPDSEPILYTLAQGYLLCGDTDKALSIYRHIVELNPRALEALLYLANHYYDLAQHDRTQTAEALLYFRQAAKIRNTPYIDNAIKQFEGAEKR